MTTKINIIAGDLPVNIEYVDGSTGVIEAKTERSVEIEGQVTITETTPEDVETEALTDEERQRKAEGDTSRLDPHQRPLGKSEGRPGPGKTAA